MNEVKEDWVAEIRAPMNELCYGGVSFMVGKDSIVGGYGTWIGQVVVKDWEYGTMRVM